MSPIFFELGGPGPTLADYRRLVRLRGYDGATDAQIDDAVNEGRRRLVRDHRWSFLETTTALLSTTANDPEVDLSSLQNTAHIDAVRPALAGVESNLMPVEYQVLRFRQVDLPMTGLPEMWSRRAGTLLLYPTPDQVYTLNLDTVVKPTALTAGEDPLIPDGLQELVVWAACTTLAFRQRDAWAAPTAENNYLAALRMAVSQDNVRQRQQSDQVRTGYWGS